MHVLAMRALLAIPTLKMSKFTIQSDFDVPALCSYWTYEDDGIATRVPVGSPAFTQFDLNKRTKSLTESKLVGNSDTSFYIDLLHIAHNWPS